MALQPYLQLESAAGHVRERLPLLPPAADAPPPRSADVMLGRAPDATIRLLKGNISRRHARIEVLDGGAEIVLHVLGNSGLSHNGLHLSSGAVAPLQDQDVLLLHRWTFRLVFLPLGSSPHEPSGSSSPRKPQIDTPSSSPARLGTPRRLRLSLVANAHINTPTAQLLRVSNDVVRAAESEGEEEGEADMVVLESLDAEPEQHGSLAPMSPSASASSRASRRASRVSGVRGEVQLGSSSPAPTALGLGLPRSPARAILERHQLSPSKRRISLRTRTLLRGCEEWVEKMERRERIMAMRREGLLPAEEEEQESADEREEEAQMEIMRQLEAEEEEVERSLELDLLEEDDESDVADLQEDVDALHLPHDVPPAEPLETDAEAEPEAMDWEASPPLACATDSASEPVAANLASAPFFKVPALHSTLFSTPQAARHVSRARASLPVAPAAPITPPKKYGSLRAQMLRSPAASLLQAFGLVARQEQPVQVEIEQQDTSVVICEEAARDFDVEAQIDAASEELAEMSTHAGDLEPEAQLDVESSAAFDTVVQPEAAVEETALTEPEQQVSDAEAAVPQQLQSEMATEPHAAPVVPPTPSAHTPRTRRKRGARHSVRAASSDDAVDASQAAAEVAVGVTAAPVALALLDSGSSEGPREPEPAAPTPRRRRAAQVACPEDAAPDAVPAQAAASSSHVTETEQAPVQPEIEVKAPRSKPKRGKAAASTPAAEQADAEEATPPVAEAAAVDEAQSSTSAKRSRQTRKRAVATPAPTSEAEPVDVEAGPSACRDAAETAASTPQDDAAPSSPPAKVRTTKTRTTRKRGPRAETEEVAEVPQEARTVVEDAPELPPSAAGATAGVSERRAPRSRRARGASAAPTSDAALGSDAAIEDNGVAGAELAAEAPARKARAATSAKGKKLPLGAASSDNAPTVTTDAEHDAPEDAAPKKGKTTRRKAAPASAPTEEQEAEHMEDAKPKTRKARAPAASTEASSDAAPGTAAATKGKARAKRAVAPAADEENEAPEAVETELDVRTTRRGTRRR